MKNNIIISRIFQIGRNNLMRVSLVVCFMLITVIGKAQDQFIGESYGDINTEMLAVHNANINTGETNIAGQYQATFKVGDGFAYSFLFNKADNICTGVKEILNKDAYDTSVRKLNNDYKKVDDTHWISKDNNYRISLDLLEDAIVIIHLKYKK